MQKIASSVLILSQNIADLSFDVYELSSKDTKRRERGNEESDSVFSISRKRKIEKHIHDLIRFSCLRDESLRFFF